jgi:tRNA (guanine37-N1)-methyltransferase
MEESWEVDVTPRVKGIRSMTKEQRALLPRKILRRPDVFGHYVMNLPATAIEFLDAFVGLYKGKEAMFEAGTGRSLPTIHVHCFSTKSDDNVKEHKEICERISERLGYKMEVGRDELDIWDVRTVAPNKRMFCASFRLPSEVAFR